jgi:hypothetical protein
MTDHRPKIGHFTIRTEGDHIYVEFLNADRRDPRYWPKGTPAYSAGMTREAFKDMLPQLSEMLIECMTDEAELPLAPDLVGRFERMKDG